MHLSRSEQSVFSLPRKQAYETFTDKTAGGLIIEAIEPIGEAECTCIQVDADDSLYLTTDYVVTHNTITGAYETTAHLTGLYPHWWEGKRFTGPVTWWACGKSNETTRDIVQHALLGDVTFDTDDGRKGFAGKGMIPAHLMGRTIWRRGSDDAVDNILVKHVTGGWSRVGFKSYEQKRGAFEGTARHGIWLDEECPLDIYGECLIRTATTGGIIMLTYTPLEGLSETTLQFMPGFGD
ncbi:MAG: hypothetical protein E5V63_04235 [Mesorhizobium sp.]|nr:MAG: hypothetical protein E5V63_04235 [Mesorhizobium sp.]